FDDAHDERVFSKRLVAALCAMKERPWPEVNKGREISETWLARRLRSFGIKSKTLRIGNDRAKGYELAEFTDAFERYLPQQGESKRDTVTSLDFTGNKPTFGSVTTPEGVTVSKAHETPENSG